jgi:hypothetical protein
VHLEPAAIDGEFEACTIFGRAAAVPEEKRLVDFIDVDAALNWLTALAISSIRRAAFSGSA